MNRTRPLPAPQVKENAVTKLGQLYAAEKDAQAIRTLLTELRPLFGALPKAKTAKLVRALIEAIASVPDSTQLQVSSPCARSAPM